MWTCLRATSTRRGGLSLEWEFRSGAFSTGLVAAVRAPEVRASRSPSDLALVSESDANAVSLGYKADATKVDLKKYPAHKVTHNCSNCALFQGKAKDAAGGCPIFPGKQVSAKAWCSAYQPKAA